MKKIYLAAPLLLALAAASCTKSEVLESNDGEIRFNVVANNATKAADIFCNNNLPEKFKVYATTESKTYIDGDDIVNNEGTWENKSGVRYWPETPVDFYAHVNAGDNFKWSTESAPTIKDFTPSATVADQLDLLYAVKIGQNKKSTPVELNFRHALSQIVFNAKNTNENLYVEIKGVKIVNVGGTNTFTYPTTDTDSKFVSHDGTGELPPTGAGSWAELTSGASSYEVDFTTAIPVAGGGSIVDLTTANDSGNEFNSQAMLLLPQTTTAWDPEAAPAPGTNNTGSYFLIDCAIWNVATDEINKEDDVQLWGENGATKELAIPVTFAWEQGKKYIYTFVFGKGNGGYDPENPDPNPEDPDPVLVPIDFKITVDDFQVVTPSIDIESGISDGSTTGE